MKELLLGWLIKPELMQTPLDGLIFFAEVIITFVIITTIYSIYLTIKENIEDKKKGE